MGTTHPAGKRERLEARLTAEQKELFQHAADLSGRSLTDFVITAVQAVAEETIRTHEIMRLTTAGTAAFADALLNPPAPNERLRRAVQGSW